MRKFRKNIILILILHLINTSVLCAQNWHENDSSISKKTNYRCSIKDKQLFEKVLIKAQQNNWNTLSTDSLIIVIGLQFLNTPYVAYTLDKDTTENLVINYNALDCVTYLETVLALVKTIQQNQYTMEGFSWWLNFIRYRGGIRKQYPSRLHYFSDWLHDNQKKMVIKDITQNLGGVNYPNFVDFMTKNKEKYPQLNSNKDFLDEMRNIEQSISARKYSYLPKEMLKKTESQIKNGDLVIITTNIKGLDAVHVGFAYHYQGRLHLLHESLGKEEVVVSELPLTDYLAKRKIQSGIIVARLL